MRRGLRPIIFFAEPALVGIIGGSVQLFFSWRVRMASPIRDLSRLRSLISLSSLATSSLRASLPLARVQLAVRRSFSHENVQKLILAPSERHRNGHLLYDDLRVL